MIQLMAAALLLGVAVTFLEAVCTGQMYVPTLLYIIKMVPNSFIPLLLLCWYNLMFVLPLIGIICFLVIGGSNEVIHKIFKENLFVIKMLQGLFFIGLFLIILFN